MNRARWLAERIAELMFVPHAFFERAVARRCRPLLVCFNRPLAEPGRYWRLR